MPEQPTTFGQRAKRAFRRLLYTLLFLALVAAVLYLLSERNARTYTLKAQSDSLVVLKGDFLPIGAHPYRPADPALSQAYAPFPLSGSSPGELDGKAFTDRDEMDRALFSFLDRVARANLDSDDPLQLQRGLQAIQRADGLPGLRAEQRETLKRLKEEIAYFMAKNHLEDARRLVDAGLEQLRTASASKSRHARSASQMLMEVEPAAKALSEALRRAVHSLSEPPKNGATPAPSSPQ